MSMAWEVTEEDIAQVFERRGMRITEEEVEEMHDNFMDGDRVEEAALAYTDMEDQVEAALNEIELVLIENGYLSPRGETE